MKQIGLMMIIAFLGCNSLSNNANKGNVLLYDKKIEITLPDKYYLESSVIYDNDSNKIGEFSPGLITPLKKTSFSYICKLYKDGGELKAKETSMSYGDFQPNIIKIDSVQLTNYKWYYVVNQMPYEGGSDNDYGLWNSYNFITFENDRILFITFYNKDIKNDKFDYFANFIKTIKIK
jgi:hypothetical protein